MLIDDFTGRKMLVVGDVMLDHFVAGTVDRVSPEAPALVLRVSEERTMLGGAANVAMNIASLGGSAILVGAVGEDQAGEHLVTLVRGHSGLVSGIVASPELRTTEKTRYIAGNRHLLRADRDAVGLSRRMEELVIARIAEYIEDCHAAVVSDYAKGVVSSQVMAAVVRLARKRGIPVVADPKKRSFQHYSGADVITPNLRELEFATGEACDDDASCERAAKQAIALTGAAVVLTRSEQGIAAYELDGAVWSEAAHGTVVRDVSGAGDTVLAACAISLAAGASLPDAAHVANVAAAVAISKSGTACVTQEELNFALLHSPDMTTLAGKLLPLTSAMSVRELWRTQGARVGFTNGCFDLLHPGHVKLLHEARNICDRLIVALNTDASVQRLKGPDRPVQTELARAAVIGALRPVDLVILFDEDTPMTLITTLKPDVLIKGADYAMNEVVGADLVGEWGGEVALIELEQDQSTTKLISASRRGVLANE